MRWGTARVAGESQLVFSEDSRDWYRWSDFSAKVSGFDGIHDFLSLLESSTKVVGFAESHAKTMAELQPVQIESFEKPFAPVQYRDFYAFEEHVAAGRKSRGLEMIPEWYEIPVFYFSNRLSFVGDGEAVIYPRNSQALDLELEIACVIGKQISNATPEEARDAIFGYSLLNDWSARDLQKQEMKMNLGPGKGKDFATSFGPFVVDKEELESLRKNKAYDLEFEASINSEALTKNNWSKIQFSFEEIVSHASQNTTLYPGEVLASGTMGGGCLLEHNLSKPDEEKRWLQKGDVVSLSCKALHMELKNQVD